MLFKSSSSPQFHFRTFTSFHVYHHHTLMSLPLHTVGKNFVWETTLSFFSRVAWAVVAKLWQADWCSRETPATGSWPSAFCCYRHPRSSVLVSSSVHHYLPVLQLISLPSLPRAPFSKDPSLHSFVPFSQMLPALFKIKILNVSLPSPLELQYLYKSICLFLQNALLPPSF